MSFRILFADDEPLTRLDLRESLVELGYDVVGEARDGQEAWELTKRVKPDLVILDIRMPVLDGIELAEKICDQYPVIILTAYSERHLVERARDAGVMAYVTKPCRKADLTPAIELAVSHFMKESTLTEKVDRLKEQLQIRKLVEKAKGLLMKAEGMSEAAAHHKLQRLSMSKNKSLKEVAEATIMMLEE